MLSAVVFDLDGVIVNSEPLHLRTYQDVLRGRGLELLEAEYYDRYLGFDDPVLFEALSRERGLGWTAQDIDAIVRDKVRRYKHAIQSERVLFPGAVECVTRFASEVPLAVASGALHEEIELVLELAGLRHCFRALVGSDDTPHSKPAPDPYIWATLLLGGQNGSGPLTPSHVVAIEDSRLGVESARAAGLRTVAVTNTYPASELARADLVVGSLENLRLDMLRALCE